MDIITSDKAQTFGIVKANRYSTVYIEYEKIDPYYIEDHTNELWIFKNKLGQILFRYVEYPKSCEITIAHIIYRISEIKCISQFIHGFIRQFSTEMISINIKGLTSELDSLVIQSSKQIVLKRHTIIPQSIIGPPGKHDAFTIFQRLPKDIWKSLFRKNVLPGINAIQMRIPCTITISPTRNLERSTSYDIHIRVLETKDFYIITCYDNKKTDACPSFMTYTNDTYFTLKAYLHNKTIEFHENQSIPRLNKLDEYSNNLHIQNRICPWIYAPYPNQLTSLLSITVLKHKPKMYDNEHIHLITFVKDILSHLNSQAILIQRQFRKAISNPEYAMCRNRLLREFSELEAA